MTLFQSKRFVHCFCESYGRNGLTRKTASSWDLAAVWAILASPVKNCSAVWKSESCYFIYGSNQWQLVRFGVGGANIFCSCIVCITATIVVVHVYNPHIWFSYVDVHFCKTTICQVKIVMGTTLVMYFKSIHLTLQQMTTDSYFFLYHTKSDPYPLLFYIFLNQVMNLEVNDIAPVMVHS